MSLLFMDGFDAGDATIKWSSSSTTNTSTTTRFSSGRSLHLSAASSNVMKSFQASSQVFIGFAVLRGSLTSGYELCEIRADSGTTTHLRLYFSPSGALLLNRASVQIASSAVEQVAQNTWAYIEISATLADSGGRVVVRVNGNTAIDFTGDTRNSGSSTNIDSLTLSGVPGASTLIDDLYICNSTGAAPYNDFLGDVRVATLTPNGAGSSTGFASSSGANYTAVDELPYSTSDYISATSSGTRDLYTFNDLAGSYDILGVQNNVIAKKLDAGGTAIKPVIATDGTAYFGPNKVLASSDTTATGTWSINPSTSAPWTLTDINNLEAGMEIV